jgi:hypothetical protein
MDQVEQVVMLEAVGERAEVEVLRGPTSSGFGDEPVPQVLSHPAEERQELVDCPLVEVGVVDLGAHA